MSQTTITDIGTVGIPVTDEDKAGSLRRHARLREAA